MLSEHRNKEWEILETLKTVFGFRSFRPNQESIIKNILNKQDVFAVMPTGGGKSLAISCRQRYCRAQLL